MLTLFQRKKLTLLFNTYDIDNSGSIEQADYQKIAHNIAKLYHVVPYTPEYKTIQSTFLRLWNNIEKLADLNADKQVTLSEFLVAYGYLLNYEDTFIDTVKEISKFIIKLTDIDNDGKISEVEWVTNQKAYQISEDNAKIGFHKLDRDNNGYISIDEYMTAIEEFYYSEDETAPGNWLIGPFQDVIPPED